jgi:hypothetical protein
LIIRQTSPEDIAGWFDVFDQRHEVICIPLPDLGSSTASEQQLRDLINRFYALDSAMGGRVALVKVTRMSVSPCLQTIRLNSVGPWRVVISKRRSCQIAPNHRSNPLWKLLQ